MSASPIRGKSHAFPKLPVLQVKHRAQLADLESIDSLGKLGMSGVIRFGRNIVVVVFAVLLLACDGGDGILPESQQTANDGTNVLNPPSTSSLNPGLSGSLLMRAPLGASRSVVRLLMRMDLRSGRYELLPYSNWRERFPRTDDFSFVAFPMLYERGGLALTAPSCEPTESCVAILDARGNYQDVHLFDSLISQPARLSRDGSHFAVVERFSGGVRELGVYRSTGEFVSSGSDISSTDEPDWLPDGRLVFPGNSNRSFFFTFPFSAEVANNFTLPQSVEGSIREFAVSPDGARIAFVLESPAAETDRELWTMGVADGALKRVARAAPPTSSGANVLGRLTWSPDGEFILIQQVSDIRTGIIVARDRPWLMAVPTDSETTLTIGQDGTSSAEVIQLRRFELRRDSNDQLQLGDITTTFEPGRTFWQP